MNQIRTLPNKSKIFLDYAHTPDALKMQYYQYYKNIIKKKISLVFGCGGDRDKSKRKLMERLQINTVIEFILQTIILEQRAQKNKKSDYVRSKKL